jgi:hypothetical protein
MTVKNNIFINCPFDGLYISTLLKPMLYTLLEFGFEPQLALIRSDSGEFRLNKIVELIKKSTYSIHDLSRIKSSKPEEYYRLNMPFELGIDYGIRLFEIPDKKFLILEAEQHETKKALSDISGCDIKCHNNHTNEIIECVRSWCIETVGLKNIKSGAEIEFQYDVFNIALLENLSEQYKRKYDDSKAQEFTQKQIEYMPIPEYIEYIKDHLQKK